MTKELDVLVLENRPRAAEPAVAALEAAGHRVHRCHDPGDRGFPCRGVAAPELCPMEGSIDVALVVRHDVTPRPTALEDGVSCAIRSRVPLVEDGSDLLDPFDPWLAERVGPDQDVVAACVAAASSAYEPLKATVIERIDRLLVAGRIDPEGVTCEIERDGLSLRVHLRVPAEVDDALAQALAVRTLDAVRVSGRTYGRIDVQVTGT
jgi:hypothetical protein